MNVVAVPVLSDNYVWIAGDGPVIIIDPGEARPVADYLDRHGLQVAAYFITHHHGDHVGGLSQLARAYPAPIYGPADEAQAIGAIDQPLAGGDRFEVTSLGATFDVLDVPGHTLGHIAFYTDGLLFSGDALFRGGCGRVFEGSFDAMRTGLAGLRRLPDQTRVYGGHEYTEKNLDFAARVEPDNPAIAGVRDEVAGLRAQGEPSLPGLLGEERQINPFLRWDQPTVAAAARQHGGVDDNDPDAVFATIRRWKDGA